MSSGKSQQGTAMIAAIILAVIACVLICSYLAVSSHDARLSKRAIEYEKATIVAEAGIDYGLIKLRDVVRNYQLSPSITTNALQGMLDAIPPPPGMDDYDYVSPDGEQAFRIKVESDVLSGTITNGTACRGSSGSYQYFSITSGATKNGGSVGAVLRQTVQVVGLFLIRFGVFYEDDLEILPGAEMTFLGPVHANGDMYPGGPLKFYDRLTSHGDIRHRRKDSADRPGEVWIANEQDELLSMIVEGEYLDSGNPDWMVEALQRWDGLVMSGAHNVPEMSPPISPMDEDHDIIERPLATNDAAYREETEEEKFANKACLRIHVSSNGTFTATDYYTNDVSSYFSNVVLVSSGSYAGKTVYAKNANGTYKLATNSPPLGAYDVTQANFVDNREGCTMAPVDIYVEKLVQCFPQLQTGYAVEEGRCIVYVTRDDPDGVSNGVMPCVRLRNGTTLPSQGLTVASDLPVYVEGDYNVVTTKTSLVAGDAVNMLSKAWQDARSTASKPKRTATSTDYYTVVMTGNSETTTGDYNGGLENVLRFLENWSGKTVEFRGSIIDIWYSEIAVGKWYYDSYGGTFRYTAPTRDWGYDNIYLTQNPPGMTRVFGMEELMWTRSNWGDEGL